MEKTPIILISCSTFESIFKENGFEDLFDQRIYLDSGLHMIPKHLKQAVQDSIDQISEPSLIVLGYGLCGNGLSGIKASGHTLLIPKADDCIALLMGSRERYLNMKRETPGSYFMTKGWLEADATPLSEYNTYLEHYGEDNAKRIMDMQYRNYTKLIFVAHREQDFGTYEPLVQPVAKYCSQWMDFEEYLGSLEYLKRLIDSIDGAAAGTLQSNGEFIVIPPGGELQVTDFLGG